MLPSWIMHWLHDQYGWRTIMLLGNRHNQLSNHWLPKMLELYWISTVGMVVIELSMRKCFQTLQWSLIRHTKYWWSEWKSNLADSSLPFLFMEILSKAFCYSFSWKSSESTFSFSVSFLSVTSQVHVWKTIANQLYKKCALFWTK